MKRRSFIAKSVLLTGGAIAINRIPLSGFAINDLHISGRQEVLYSIFRDTESVYRPFVRWWWNGDKIKKKELARELQLLKEAGIGGVEINPIEFPGRMEGDDLGIKSLSWLGDEWIEMLSFTFAEAKKLDLTCDLIVGSGWPFGSETLRPEERAEVVILYTEKIEGPARYEISKKDIFKAIDPGVTVPNPERTFEIISLKLVADPMESLNAVMDIEDKEAEENISIDIPQGRHVFYALVNVKSFASVINGAPGAAGHILNHMDEVAVRKYLNHMSETIEAKTGPLSGHLRALFSDSMELEGCNWTTDFSNEFIKRRGYDLMPWLPFIMFKVGRLGAVVDDKYGAAKTNEFSEELNRVRFDFEFTKAELLNERFTQTYLKWCRELNVKSRAQAYGRGFFPLETSLGYDIPEGESWTTNWLKHRVGEEMPDEDYRRGRAYTMINKYVSSAAHLAGKRIVSCEEMTNTYLVFNTSLERLKVGSDQSIISGVTHSVWHGYNYSPPGAPYPGWIQYGSYYNENNNWWPYFKLLNSYKARISALLQNADMYTDIAILPANNDLWGEMGVQTDPFPEKLNVQYTSLLWEAINKCGAAADYISDIIINKSDISKGKICYGPKEYGVLFLAGVKGINPETMAKLYEFVVSGGRIFCIDTLPEKALGYKDYLERDRQVVEWVNKISLFTKSFILLNKPGDNRFLEWYREVGSLYNIPHYLDIETPSRFFMQNRYTSDDGSNIFFFINTHLEKEHKTRVAFSQKITRGKFGWIWDPETGERYRIDPDKQGGYWLKMGPAESLVIVFDKNSGGTPYMPLPVSGPKQIELSSLWEIEFIHCRGESIEPMEMMRLTDLRDIPGYENFSGTIIYKTKVQADIQSMEYINLGRVNDLAEVLINGYSCGVRWYGNRVFKITGMLREGENIIEVRVQTLMGNYMKSLGDNPNAQYWTNLGRKEQALTSLGLIGPVNLYKV